MKKTNYYELKNEKKEEYRVEFNKLNYVKNLSRIRLICLLLIIFGLVVGGVLSSLADEGINVSQGADFVINIGIMAFLVYVPVCVYDSWCFKRWLKIKHSVEY